MHIFFLSHFPQVLISRPLSVAQRLLNEPRPLVVGIAWVVECVEQRARVDEARFLVDLENVNVAGTNKVSQSDQLPLRWC